MNKLFLLLLFLPFFAHAQTIRIPGLGKAIVGGHPLPPSLPVDTTAEVLVFSPIMNNSFDATRPNKRVYVTGTLFYNENYINPGYSGTVTFVNTGGFVVTVNGSGGTFTGTVVAIYTYSGGVVWSL